jgi:hypothetical protein
LNPYLRHPCAWRYCRAKVGEWCKNSGGGLANRLHRNRIATLNGHPRGGSQENAGEAYRAEREAAANAYSTSRGIEEVARADE